MYSSTQNILYIHKIMYNVIIMKFPFYLTYTLGLETQQYRGQGGLFFEDPGLWSCTYCRPDIQHDSLCGDPLLPGTRGHRGHEVQGKWCVCVCVCVVGVVPLGVMYNVQNV